LFGERKERACWRKGGDNITCLMYQTRWPPGGTLHKRGGEKRMSLADPVFSGEKRDAFRRVSKNHSWTASGRPTENDPGTCSTRRISRRNSDRKKRDGRRAPASFVWSKNEGRSIGERKNDSVRRMKPRKKPGGGRRWLKSANRGMK